MFLAGTQINVLKINYNTIFGIKLYLKMSSLQEFQTYRLSLSRSSNTVSCTLLTESLDVHSDIFDNKTLKTAEGNLKKLFSNNTSTWKSSLSERVSPEELFSKNTPKCTTCSQNININYNGFDQLIKNKCKCNGDNGEEPKELYKPVFSRHKTIKNNQIPEPKLQKRCDTIPSNYNTKNKVPKEMEYDIEIVDEEKANASNVNKIIFKTAKEQFYGSNTGTMRVLKNSKKSQGKFVSPMIRQDKPEPIEVDDIDDRLKHLDPKMVELIENEIIDKGTPIGWDDIAGLQLAKSVIQEAVVWPLLRPDIFTGLRRPPKGILLFGPPGTGKTLIGKCVAAQCNATFFSISASSLTSKWIGDGEKMVRALFAVARCRQPAVIFIDEIDSLLTQRSDTEHESSRRIKTEFLVQFDGAATAEEDRLLIIGATNRPQELDEAARRRLVKRLYVPLPELQARQQIITNLLTNESNSLTESEVSEVALLAEGFSGADMKSLCSEAAMGPIRSVPLSQIVSIHKDNMRPVNINDFKNALERVRPSVSQNDLGQYVKWNKTYGQGL